MGDVVNPRVYTLCGSSRFPEAFHLVNAHLSLQGHIVISLGLFGHADEPRGSRFLTSDADEKTPEKMSLDVLHKRKIDLADAIFVVNVGGYVGNSTKSEIAYAQATGKAVEWLFPPVDDVAFLRGVKAGLEAAAQWADRGKATYVKWVGQCAGHDERYMAADAIRGIDPASVTRKGGADE